MVKNVFSLENTIKDLTTDNYLKLLYKRERLPHTGATSLFMLYYFIYATTICTVSAATCLSNTVFPVSTVCIAAGVAWRMV